MLTPAQRYEVGKRAAEHGVTASIRYFAKKYPKLPLKETSARRFKILYVAECKQKVPMIMKKFKNCRKRRKVDHFSYQTN